MVYYNVVSYNGKLITRLALHYPTGTSLPAAALLSDERLTEDVRLHIADRNYD